jgi:hypothetical protein
VEKFEIRQSIIFWFGNANAKGNANIDMRGAIYKRFPEEEL